MGHCPWRITGPTEPALLGRRAASLGRALCLIGAAIGALGLVGWFMGSPSSRGCFPPSRRCR